MRRLAMVALLAGLSVGCGESADSGPKPQDGKPMVGKNGKVNTKAPVEQYETPPPPPRN